MWYLFDPTPSGWGKTDAHSTDFSLRTQINTSRISLNLWTHLTLTVKIRKERACVYFNFPYAIKLAIGLNVFQQDPSPYGRILLPDSLLNSFHREGPQNSETISWCSNNIMENLYPKHGLVLRTYSKKSLIMVSIVGFKSKFSMIMSPFILNARLTAPPPANSTTRIPTNLGKLLRTSPSTTMKDGMKQKN
ncbi:hypothetical protein Tco_1510234 [Tanacetum coccineum]